MRASYQWARANAAPRREAELQGWAEAEALRAGGIVVDATASELQRVFFLQLRIIGSTMGTRSELAELLSFCVQAGIRPQIGAELPMTEAAKAFQLMMNGETGGKVVLTR